MELFLSELVIFKDDLQGEKNVPCLLLALIQ